MLDSLKRNWSIKVLSLAIAVTMWLFVVGQEKSEVSLRVPIEMLNLPPDTLVLEDNLAEVDARLYGPRSLIRRLAAERVSKSVDLAGLGVGAHVFQVLPDDLRLPPGVKVLRISPDTFTLTLARREVREVPVRPVFKGQPAPGLEVVEVRFRPEKVVLTGSKEDLASLDWVWSMPIEVSERRESFSQPIPLRPPRGRSVRLSHSEVEASVVLQAQPAAVPHRKN